jgi:thiosulfate dehydrogenase
MRRVSCAHDKSTGPAGAPRAHWKLVSTAVLVAGVLTVHPAAAETAGERIARQGRVESGVMSCSSCHGVDGGGNEQSGFPRLAGLDATYIERQLLAFKEGKRKNPVMEGMAAPLTDQNIRDVALYYAGLPPVNHAQAPAGVSTATGESLAAYGDMADRGLPGCFQCHGSGGSGVGQAFPPLTGQPYSYLLVQLKAWKSGARGGEPLGLMMAVSSRLTDAEAESVAAYLAGLPLADQDERGDRKATIEESNRGEGPFTTADARSRGTPTAYQGEVEPGRALGASGYFQPPAHGTAPEGKMGDMVRLGEAMFRATSTHPVSARYVGNKQACSGCHLDAGRLANSAPMWASWVAYPAYREKNHRVNTFIERVQGCFTYSMNAQDSAVGHAPEADSEVMLGLVSYVYWLATGAPTGDQRMAGRGYPSLAEPAAGFDPTRGARVYAESCAVCHGDNGAGQAADGQIVFPPLWGPDSYNWGAGMHNIRTAAAFIRFNMPFGLAEPVQRKAVLGDQQAWDVAAYINSQERPQDPRFNGDVAAARKAWHDSEYDYYGKPRKPDGRLLGDGAALR